MSTTDLVAAPSQPVQRFAGGRVLRLVLGTIGLLAALAFIGGGGALTWALETHRDASGYFTTHTHHYRTSSYALSTQALDVSGITGTLAAGLGRLRITVASTDTVKPLFVGIARTEDVDRYLAAVEHDELRDIELDPFRIVYRRLGAEAPTTLPGDRSFWQTRAGGTGAQTIEWPIEKGRWTAVVMNADGSPDVAVDAQLAARLAGAGWFVAAFLAAGALSLLGGAALVRSGARKRAPGATEEGSR